MAVSEEIQRQVLAEATSATPNYSVDYEDERFKEVDKAIDDSWNEYHQSVGGMIDDVDGYYDKLADHTQQWADKQAQIQQENTDFAIEKIEQQKDQAHKDYLKEQSGAYVDWRKQSNQYGTEAEKMASAGLVNTGFSESSQVSMYNTYQNRVATAREVMAQAKLNYDNNIKEAMLQNNAALAEIYANAYQKQLELSLEGFQYKNQLVLNLADKKLEFENTKWNRYQDVLQQINTENALAEEIRQFNTELEWKTEQAELDHQRQLERDRINNEFTEKLEGIKHNYELALLDAKTEKEKELIELQHQKDLEKIEEQKKNALAELDKKLANEKALYAYQQGFSTTQHIGGRTYTSVSGGQSNSTPITNSSNNEVNTAYYQGAKNPDAKNGTFANGYQPNNVNGSKLTKTGETTNVHTTIQYGDNKGQKVIVKQNVWKDESGKKWVWDGRNNKYVAY